MTEYEMNNRIKTAITNHYNDNFRWFITLTYRYEVTSVERVAKHIKLLVNHLRQQLYGRHAAKHFDQSKKLMMFGSVERHATGAIHLHLLLSEPPHDVKQTDKNKRLLNNAAHELLNFWEFRKRFGYQNKLVDLQVEQVQVKKDSTTACGYVTKHSNMNNPNFFITHWDANEHVLPIECRR